MLVAWFATRPSDEYDDVGGLFLAALLSLFLSGFGWQLLGGWGCTTGCAIQIARFVGLIALIVYDFAAFNPHMDNWCNDSGNIDACQENALQWFTRIYFALALSPLVSASMLGMRRRLGIAARLNLD